MFKKRIFILALLLISLSINATAEFTVRTIYFQPQGTKDHVDRIRNIMADVHELYASEMERHGFGEKTFRLETENDQVVVHTVRGKHNAAHYAAAPKSYIAIAPELPDEFSDQTSNIHIIFVGGLRNINGGKVLAIGVASFGHWAGGYAMLPAENFSMRLVAHEVGHTFGLGHNADVTFIMASGPEKFSHNETRWLDKSHYFNVPPDEIRFVPTIENISTLRLIDEKMLRLEMDVGSPNGVYQAEMEQWSNGRVLQWDYLNGQLHDRAEFTFNTVNLQRDANGRAKLLLRVMDRNGNMWIKRTELSVPKQRVKNIDLVAVNPEPTPEPTETPKTEPEKDETPRAVTARSKLISLWASLKLPVSIANENRNEIPVDVPNAPTRLHRELECCPADH